MFSKVSKITIIRIQWFFILSHHLSQQSNSKKQQSMTNRIEEYKVAVCGAGAAGKSSLTVQFVQNVFLTDYDRNYSNSREN
jgi:GTPase SAR1 family protein